MTDAPPAEKKRSKRIYAYWAAAFALLLALGLFSWCVVRPVLEVRRCLTGAWTSSQPVALEGIDRLGGPERAAVKLSLYLRFAARSSEEKKLICWHLGFCGPGGTPALARTLRDEDPVVREVAINALGYAGDPRAVDILTAALGDESDDVRCVTAEALGWLGDKRAVGPLEAIPRDAPGDLGGAAARALKMIRARDLDYCRRLDPGAKLDDRGPALIAIARFHVREGMSRSEVAKLLRGIAWADGTGGMNVTFVNSDTFPSAHFQFEKGRAVSEKDRLVSWKLSWNFRTWYYPGEKYRR